MSDVGNRKCFAVIFICLLVLFVLAFPIRRFLNLHLEQPLANFGECHVEGDLEFRHIHLVPGPSSASIYIMFATNIAVSKLLSVRYGTTAHMEYETFTTSVQAPNKTDKFPYKHSAHILILSPGELFYYQIECGEIRSDRFTFHSWRQQNAWSPHITLYGAGHVTNDIWRQVLQVSHTADLMIHMGMQTKLEDMDNYMNRLSAVSSHVPHLVLPSHGESNDVDEYSHQLGWTNMEMSVDDTFSTTVGPVKVVTFNGKALLSESRNSVLLSLRENLKHALKSEKTQWLVVMSHETNICIPSISSVDVCHELFHLFMEFDVDLYIIGQAPGYHRSWTIGKDGSVFSTYHNAKGLVMLLMPSNLQANINVNTLLEKSDLFMKKLQHFDTVMITLETPKLSSLCITGKSLPQMTVVDHFCIDKASMSARLAELPSLTQYDYTTWLTLVIILSVTFTILIVFRKYLYSKLCLYLKPHELRSYKV